jgi:hypothetical protein
MNSHGLYNLDSHSVSLQRPKEEGAPHFIPCPKQPLQSNTQYLIGFLFFKWEKIKIDGLSTIVWISNHVSPKLPLRVRRLGQTTLSCRHFKKQQPLDLDL